MDMFDSVAHSDRISKNSKSFAFSPKSSTKGMRPFGEIAFESGLQWNNETTPLPHMINRSIAISPVIPILGRNRDISPLFCSINQNRNPSPAKNTKSNKAVLPFKKIKKKKSLNSVKREKRVNNPFDNGIKDDKECPPKVSENQAHLFENRNRVSYAKPEQKDFDPVEPPKKASKVSCNCKSSKCLKLYCDCLRNNGYCGPGCNCVGCENYKDSKKRKIKVKELKRKNPLIFEPIVLNKGEGKSHMIHHRGCSCKKNGCLKNYCECQQFGVLCGFHCKCIGCQNCVDQANYNTKKQYRFESIPVRNIFKQLKYA